MAIPYSVKIGIVKLTTGEVYLCTINTTYKLLNLTFPLTLSKYGLNSTSTLKNFSLLPPDDKQFIKNIDSVLNTIHHRKNILLMGDLNIDLAKENLPYTISLNKILNNFNLTNTIRSFTRVTKRSSTLIDHVITADCSKILKSNSSDDACISDHNLIYAVYKLHTDSPPPKTLIVRDHKNVNLEKLKEDF